MVGADGARGDVFYAALPDGGEQGAVKTCAAECCDALGPVYRIDVFERQVILCFGELYAELFGDDNPSFPSVTALAAEGTDMDELCKTIESMVRSMKGISEDDEYDSVSASSMKSAIDALNSFMGAFSLIMGAVAGISLLVGGIGIMNMMLTNVTERIREIGIRRALGASRRDITAQFLAESSALCITGGILGVMIGYLLAWGLTFFAANSGIMSEFGATGTITPSFSITTVLLAFAVSVGIGVIFGFYPARRAAKLDPVECLRYQ